MNNDSQNITNNQPQPVTYQSEENNSPTGKIILIVLLLFIITGGGVFAYFNFVRKTQNVNEVVTTTPSDTNSSDVYLGEQTITLQGVNSSATITRTRTREHSIHEVRASLPDPEEGQQYQVWVSNQSETISLGTLSKSGDLYTLTNRYDYPSPPTGSFDLLLNKVVISLEDEVDDRLEETVLNGSFTE